uniref:C-type lectin domain-containing protein n=1 Tax=Acrobeloides nanus TaxID=290746 RepID=A0A914BZS5_9BILA
MNPDSGFGFWIRILNPDSESEFRNQILILIENQSPEFGFRIRIQDPVMRPKIHWALHTETGLNYTTHTYILHTRPHGGQLDLNTDQESVKSTCRSRTIAPVVYENAISRQVILPGGIWRDQNGAVIQGLQTVEVQAPLDVLPYFERICPSRAWYQSTINPNNCYNFVKSAKDWTSANNDCQQQDSRSTLTSIDSAFENNEVLTNGQSRTGCTQFFIGLQEQLSNVWTWINNDTSAYRNWRSGYPDTNAKNKCSQLNSSDGRWTNIDCSTTTGCYVCEIKNN